MEAFALYLFRSTVWLSCFALVYYLFLRNERYFALIRFFLLGGLLASLLFPLFTVRYTVYVPANQSFGPDAVLVGQPQASIVANPWWDTWLWALYGTGALVFFARSVWQLASVFRVARRSAILSDGHCKVVSTNAFSASFTCFSYVFINPSLSEPERREIIKHEAGHVLQRHWMDLVLAETVLWMQWFNPLAWIYGHFIRQNHEFLADRQVLAKAAEPAVYKAVLLNQIMGGEVLRLSHLFNYSLNKKRFKMMTNTSVPAWHKLKLLWAVPVVTAVFYAFASPDYRTAEAPLGQSNTVSVGDSAKQQGMQVRSLDNQDVVIVLDGKIIDMATMKALDPNDIKEVSVIKDAAKLVELGYKAKDGAILITMKKPSEQNPYGSNLQGVHVVGYAPTSPETKTNTETQDHKGQVYQEVEQMPEYPGGISELMKFIATQVKYPVEAQKNGIQGKVYVQFIVSKNGKVTNAKVLKGVSPALDEEAIRVVNLMPDWTPGVHKGQKVDVEYTLPISFALK